MVTESLKGKEIFVGRENGSNQLLVYLTINGKVTAFHIGNVGSVPKSVSRANPNQNKAHLSIKIENNGNIVLTNLKPQNVTFVNGSEIVSKRISENDNIQLGADRYILPLNQILDTTSKLTTSQLHNSSPSSQHHDTITYSISHLEKVWENFRDGQKEIKRKNKNIVLVRSGCGIFTMCAMPTIFFLGPIGYILTGIGVIGNVYSIWGIKKNDIDEENEKLEERLEREYLCPNPECRRYFGKLKYSLLKNQYKMQCPYCKSKFEERK